MTDDLEKSEAMRKELACAVSDLRLVNQTPRIRNRVIKALDQNDALGYSGDSPSPESEGGLSLDLSPGDAAAAEEHAANSDAGVLAERIDFQAGRIDACMEAVGAIREVEAALDE